jgi:hypothetical protein
LNVFHKYEGKGSLKILDWAVGKNDFGFAWKNGLFVEKFSFRQFYGLSLILV